MVPEHPLRIYGHVVRFQDVDPAYKVVLCIKILPVEKTKGTLTKLISETNWSILPKVTQNGKDSRWVKQFTPWHMLPVNKFVFYQELLPLL